MVILNTAHHHHCGVCDKPIGHIADPAMSFHDWQCGDCPELPEDETSRPYVTCHCPAGRELNGEHPGSNRR